MAKQKQRRKTARTFREPVPGELERDDESWSGWKVTVACGAAIAALALGLWVWQSLLAVGVIGGILSVLGPFLWEFLKHIHRD